MHCLLLPLVKLYRHTTPLRSCGKQPQIYLLIPSLPQIYSAQALSGLSQNGQKRTLRFYRNLIKRLPLPALFVLLAYLIQSPRPLG